MNGIILPINGRRLMERPRKNMVQPDTRRRHEETAGKKLERKDCGKIEDIGELSSIDP
jgi:hypothetical protein